MTSSRWIYVFLTFASLLSVTMPATLKFNGVQNSCRHQNCLHTLEKIYQVSNNLTEIMTTKRDRICKVLKDEPINWFSVNNCMANMIQNGCSVDEDTMVRMQVTQFIFTYLCDRSCDILPDFQTIILSCGKDSSLPKLGRNRLLSPKRLSAPCNDSVAVVRCFEEHLSDCPIMAKILKDATGYGSRQGHADNLAQILQVPVGYRAISECYTPSSLRYGFSSGYAPSIHLYTLLLLCYIGLLFR